MSQLKRELGSAELVANYGYAGDEVVINDFDSKYPWNSISRVVDSNGNVWIRIPKFYTKYTLDDNGMIKERYISQYNVSKEWHLNPIFVDPNGKELPYVEIAAYLINVDATTNMANSKSGVKPTTGKHIAEMRSIVEAYEDVDDGYDYALFNIWCAILEQDLFLIEFANSNTSSILQGCKYSVYSQGVKNNGETDNIPYVTGTQNAAAQTNGSSPMKYRGIENMLGNGRLVIDGIKINGGKISLSYDGVSYVNTNLTAYNGSGKVNKLMFDKDTKLVFPEDITATGSYTDQYSVNKDNNLVITRGHFDDVGCGLFTTVSIPASSTNQYNIYRMIRRPSN